MSLNHVSHSFPSHDLYQTYPTALREVQHMLLQTMEQFGECKTLLKVNTYVLPPLRRTLESQAVLVLPEACWEYLAQKTSVE